MKILLKFIFRGLYHIYRRKSVSLVAKRCFEGATQIDLGSLKMEGLFDIVRCSAEADGCLAAVIGI